MRYFYLSALLLLNVTLSFAQTQTPHLPNQVIIGFSDDANQAERQELIDQLGTPLQGVFTQANGATVIEQAVLVLVGAYPVEVDDQTYLNEIDLISTIQGNHAKVDHADLNYFLTTEQYSFSDFLGATNLDAYSPISASCEASYPGGPLDGGAGASTARVRVGVLDTGLDPYYPTINQYVGGEVNVLTDDEDSSAGITISYGYNPYNPIAPDGNGHGTAVTGIIAGLSDRANLTPANLELYIIKCFDESGNATMYNLVQAVRVAKMMQLDVLNLSWSFLPVKEDQYTVAIEDLLRSYADQDHGIIVAGAGNDRTDLLVDAYAPASYTNINNLITVGGVVGEESYCNGNLADFSNFGDLVEIAAPAMSISAPGLDGYWALNASGTSFAAPIVTSAIIQAWMVHDDATGILLPGDIHPVAQIVMNTATYVPNLDYVGIDGVVNFGSACQAGGVLYMESGNGSASELGLSGTQADLSGEFVQIFSVAPNPFSNQLNLSFNQATPTPVSVELMTLQGVKITELRVNEVGTDNVMLNVPTELPAGPYLLRMTQNGQVSGKVIIKG